MALQVICGSAVSGKTEQMYQWMIDMAQKDPQGHFCLIVPEQASLAAQEALVWLHPDHALTNIDILTFNRLSYHVFQDLHEDERSILSETGKLMLLRLAAEQQMEKLPSLRRNLRREGFLNELKSVVSELAEYNVLPEALEVQAEGLAEYPLLQAKLRDISTLYSAFMELLHRDHEMAEERMKRLAACLPKWEPLGETVFVLDGFTGFTPLQYEVLRVMLSGAKDVCLLADIGQGRTLETEKDEDDLFYMGAHMARELRALAIGAGIPETLTYVNEPHAVGEASPGKESRTDGEASPETTPLADTAFSPEIRCIEAGLFAYPKRRFQEETERVRIVRAKNPSEEVRIVLSEILKGIREGLRYRDMAIVTGTPAQYREELEEQLTDAGVPFFLDERKDMKINPLVLLAKSLLSAAEADFSYDWVFDIVKNPILTAYFGERIPAAEERIAETENYVRAMGIRGRNLWQQEWIRCYHGFPEVRLGFVNEMRAEIAAALTEVTEVLRGEYSVAEKCAALRAFFEKTGAEAFMQQEADRFKAAHQAGAAREYGGSMEAVEGLLSQAEQILSALTLPADQFRDVLSSGLSDLRLRMVPPTQDRLVIGDVRRSRLSGIRRLFILGANDGRLPETEGAGGLLSDFDREILKEHRLVLSPTAREESFFSRYYLYLLLTQPKESLFMTYAASDTDGRALLPAAVVRELRDLFPRVPIEDAAENSLYTVSTKDQGLRTLAVLLRNAEDRFLENDQEAPDRTAAALFHWFRETGSADALDQILDGLFVRYREEQLSDETAARMFRETVNSSVSRLESYAECAYAHFLKYGLTLREKEEHEISAMDIGSLLHAGLDRFFRKLKADGLDWRALTEAERSELAAESVEEAAEEEAKGLLKDTARSRYLKDRLLRVTERTLQVLTEQWKAGGFTETLTEQPFHLTVDPALLDIRGSIDRLDTYREDGKTYARVIDYKSGSRQLDYTRVYYGLQLQLLIYMEAARMYLSERDGTEAVPAGVYYYHIDDPLVPYQPGADTNELIRKELTLKGPTNGAENVLRHTAEDPAALNNVVGGLSVKKDGQLKKTANVLSDREFDELGRFVKNKALALSRDMTEGKIPVRPYRLEKETGCTYCPYSGVCGFDDRIEGFERARLKKRTLPDLTGHPSDINS